MTFDELLAARGIILPQRNASLRRRLLHPASGIPLGSSSYVLHYDSLPDDDRGDGAFIDVNGDSEAQMRLRKTKSAESVLCQQWRRPRIVVQNSQDKSGEGLVVMQGDKKSLNGEQSTSDNENDEDEEKRPFLNKKQSRDASRQSSKEDAAGKSLMRFRKKGLEKVENSFHF